MPGLVDFFVVRGAAVAVFPTEVVQQCQQCVFVVDDADLFAVDVAVPAPCPMADPAPELARLFLDRSIGKPFGRSWRNTLKTSAVGTERTLLEEVGFLLGLLTPLLFFRLS